MRRRGSDPKKDNTSRWLITYSDMMNNLLVLFMMLYAMSILDLAKFEKLRDQLSNTFSQAEAKEILDVAASGTTTVSGTEGSDAFDEIYIRLQDKITGSGYQDDIYLEQGDDYIQLRFGDSVLFYPDSPEIRPVSYPILQDIGDILKSVEDLTNNIEIGGHTATIGATTTSFFAWELSSDRAISVLKFLSGACDLPQDMMSVAGYSKYKPVGDNSNEDGRKMNRRVEIKIIRKPGT